MKRFLLAGVLLPVLLLTTGVVAAPAVDLTVTLDPGTRRLEVVAELPVAGRSFAFELHEFLTRQRPRCPERRSHPRSGWALALKGLRGAQGR